MSEDFKTAASAAYAAGLAYQRRARNATWVAPSTEFVQAAIRPQFDRAEAAEARLAEIRQAITTFQAVRVCGPDANDLAEAVRQILDRKEAGNG